MCYAENHDKVTDFVKKLKLTTAAAKLLQEIITSDALASEQFSIEKYGFISNAVARLEIEGLGLKTQFEIFDCDREVGWSCKRQTL